MLGHVQMAPTDGAAPGSSAARDFTAEPEAVSTVAALFRDHHGELVRLPRRRREVLILRYYLGLSEAEIAAVLGISPGTVKSTAARALAALARDLGEMW